VESHEIYVKFHSQIETTSTFATDSDCEQCHQHRLQNLSVLGLLDLILCSHNTSECSSLQVIGIKCEKNVQVIYHLC